MSEKDGGPAFPAQDVDFDGVQVQHPGMTQRAWFAGQVIGPLLVEQSGLSIKDRIELAFGIAELMVAESKK